MDDGRQRIHGLQKNNDYGRRRAQSAQNSLRIELSLPDHLFAGRLFRTILDLDRRIACRIDRDTTDRLCLCLVLIF